MAFPFKFGTETLVNSTTLNDQDQPSVAGLADGRFIVTWTDESASGGDTSSDSIRAQIFSADGTPSGNEFLVNTTTADRQQAPAVTALSDGGFVISWTDYSASGGDTSSRAVRAQAFNADASPKGSEFLVNTTTASVQMSPTITALADGGFVIAWTDISSSGGDTSFTAVRAQVFTDNASPVGGEFLVNTTTAESQYEPAITGLDDGRFVVAWTDDSATGGDTSSTAVRAQIFNADGSAFGAEFLVNTTTSSPQYLPTIAALTDGRFVVSWSDLGGSSPDVYGQIFSADGDRSGGQFLVNSSPSGTQFLSTITGLADGRFVASWYDGDIYLGSITAQVFNIDGSKAGEEFRVNTLSPGTKTEPSVTALADGRFMIAWTDQSATGGDTSGAAIRSQIFDPRETGVKLNGSMLGDDFVGTRYSDEMSGFIGDDALLGRNGDDDLFGEQGDDTLSGNSGNDRLYGGSGADTLKGGKGSDQLYGGAGQDDLRGGVGLDYMEGGAGNDTYTVDRAGDMVVELSGKGTDMVRTSALDLSLVDYANIENLLLSGSADLDLTGNGKKNVLTGNAGDNVLLGLGGNDTLRGNAGADTLVGGKGRDNMTGGLDADTFVFSTVAETGVTGATRDIIRDFSQIQGDQIDLSNIDAGVAAPGNQAFTFIGTSAFGSFEGQIRYVQNGANTILQGDIDGDGVKDFEIRLDGLISLTAGDFIL